MIFAKTTPKGIDVPIQRIQNKMHGKLISLWGIDETKYNCFCRCYRNQDEQGLYIPEFYTGQDGKEYIDALMHDFVYVSSFFGIGTEIQSLGGKTFKASCHLIFSLNIKQLRAAIPHRGDEEIHIDVLQALRQSLSSDTITTVITGMDNIFREYTGFRSQKAIRFEDKHPKHCFRINFDLTYTNNDCVPFSYPFDEAVGLNSVLNFGL